MLNVSTRYVNIFARGVVIEKSGFPSSVAKPTPALRIHDIKNVGQFPILNSSLLGKFMKVIAEVLGVTSEILLFLSIDRADVPDAKRELYDAMWPNVENTLHQLFLKQ